MTAPASACESDTAPGRRRCAAARRPRRSLLGPRLGAPRQPGTRAGLRARPGRRGTGPRRRCAAASGSAAVGSPAAPGGFGPLVPDVSPSSPTALVEAAGSAASAVVRPHTDHEARSPALRPRGGAELPEHRPAGTRPARTRARASGIRASSPGRPAAVPCGARGERAPSVARARTGVEIAPGTPAEHRFGDQRTQLALEVAELFGRPRAGGGGSPPGASGRPAAGRAPGGSGRRGDGCGSGSPGSARVADARADNPRGISSRACSSVADAVSVSMPSRPAGTLMGSPRPPCAQQTTGRSERGSECGTCGKRSVFRVRTSPPRIPRPPAGLSNCGRTPDIPSSAGPLPDRVPYGHQQRRGRRAVAGSPLGRRRSRTRCQAAAVTGGHLGRGGEADGRVVVGGLPVACHQQRGGPGRLTLPGRPQPRGQQLVRTPGVPAGGRVRGSRGWGWALRCFLPTRR